MFKDTLTALPYARTDSYAFVLYYRIPRTKEADEALGAVHNRFAEAAVSVGGTFYLPYRKCYSADLLLRAAPRRFLLLIADPFTQIIKHRRCSRATEVIDHVAEHVIARPLMRGSSREGDFGGTEKDLLVEFEVGRQWVFEPRS